ncbi:hypothetical protein RZS08_29790, partial [Arthrospira platensis SPKY1]|nr:hypothetical protein [Arthrospira platensis SPKY1]
MCRTAFRRREPAELERFTDQLRELRPNSTLERQLVTRARWLGWRARRAAASEVTADSTPVEEAR